MQVIIPAGGYGTRLYPLTLDTPKSMVPVVGKPMIEYLIEKLSPRDDISRIFIVSNEKFAHVFEKWLAEHPDPKITIVNDGTTSNETRLWAVGDIHFLLEKYPIEDDLLIFWGDNLFEDNLNSTIATLKEKGNVVGLYDVGDLELAKQFGNVELDHEHKIVSFVEKPANPTSTLCATMIYGIKKEDIHYISELSEEGKRNNVGEIKAGEMIAHIMKYEPVWGQVLQWKWFDIGTLEQLQKVEEWIKLKNG